MIGAKLSLLFAAIILHLPALAQVQQSIQSGDTQHPVIYGLVIDNSKSIGPQFKEVIEAAKTIVNNNRPGDETFVVRFIDSSHIETVQDFTNDKTIVLDALGKLYTQLGQSAVVDAVYVSAERVTQYKKGGSHRPALVVITDGDDRNSYYKQDQLFEFLHKSKVQVFVIGLVNELDTRKVPFGKSSREKAIKFLQRLAQETGARAFFLESTAELPGIADAIVSELRGS